MNETWFQQLQILNPQNLKSVHLLFKVLITQVKTNIMKEKLYD